jgi:uncharacterized protein (TIGR02246 family)
MPSRHERRSEVKSARYASVALLLLAASCAPHPPADTRAADEAAIRDLDVQWSKTAQARDLDGTVSYYSDDASVMAPNAPIATTKDAIRAIWATLVAPGVSTSWTATKVDVARSGDLAYVLGVYDVTTTDPQGKPATEHGKLVEVWKKQADGKWKTVADIFNSDLPLPAPAEPKKNKKSNR